MGEAAIYFLIFLLIVLSAINVILTLSVSMVLVKVFELTKAEEERYRLEEEAKRQAKQLMNITTPQIPY